MNYLKIRYDLKNYLQIALADTNPKTLEKVLVSIDDLYHKDMIQLKADLVMDKCDDGIKYDEITVPAGEWVTIFIDPNDGNPDIFVMAENDSEYDGYSTIIGFDVADYYLGGNE